MSVFVSERPLRFSLHTSPTLLQQVLYLSSDELIYNMAEKITLKTILFFGNAPTPLPHRPALPCVL
jgi:hypothetical protein